MSEKLTEILKQKNYKFFIESPTNQKFIVLKNDEAEKLSKKVKVSMWEYPDKNHTVVRFAASWATSSKQVDELKRLL